MEAMEFDYKEVDIIPYTHKELAMMYKTNPRTLTRWLAKFKDELGERVGHHYNIKQVKIIFKKLDVPSRIK